MIVHVALYKWKKGIAPMRIEYDLKKIRELKDKCTGIEAIYCGKNYHKESKGFEYGVVILARDQKSLDAFKEHPDHAVVANDVKQILEDRLRFDFRDS